MKLQDLIKTPLVEENQAIKVSHYGGSYEKEPVTIYRSSRSTTFRFSSVPTEITVPATSDMMDRFYEIKDFANDEGKKYNLSKEEIQKILGPVRDKFFDRLGMEGEDSDLSRKYKKEISEILDHVIVILKAKAIEFNHEVDEIENEVSEEMKKDIAKVMATHK